MDHQNMESNIVIFSVRQIFKNHYFGVIHLARIQAKVTVSW